MTSHEVSFFKNSKILRLIYKNDIEIEKEKWCKRLDDRDFIEKALWNGQTKGRQQKKLVEELEILGTYLEKVFKS